MFLCFRILRFRDFDVLMRRVSGLRYFESPALSRLLDSRLPEYEISMFRGLRFRDFYPEMQSLRDFRFRCFEFFFAMSRFRDCAVHVFPHFGISGSRVIGVSRYLGFCVSTFQCFGVRCFDLSKLLYFDISIFRDS